MAPFRGIFAPIELGTTGNDVAAVFDTSVLFAMIIYGIVALGFSVLIGWLSGRLDQIHAAEDELARQAEVEQRQAEADARLLAAQQAAVRLRRRRRRRHRRRRDPPARFLRPRHRLLPWRRRRRRRSHRRPHDPDRGRDRISRLIAPSRRSLPSHRSRHAPAAAA